MLDREQEAILMATDEKRLLPGEQPVSNLKDMMEHQSQEAQDELERADVQVLVLQVERFERRLAFWQAKLAEHNGHPGAGGE